MNKLFKAGLAVFTMAMLATSASAFSPVWQSLPDVLIGGCEGGGLVFTNAFDVFDYLSDDDNTSPQLSVYFAEGPWDANAARSAQETDGSTSSEITINSQSEIDYSGPGDVNLDDQSLLTGGELTGVDSGLTFATLTDGIDRAVVLIASDGFTSPSVSKVFRVRSDLLECDAESFPVSVTNVDGWDLQSEFNADWAYAGFPDGGGAAPTSGATGDALTITSSAANTGVGFWQLGGAATKIPTSAASAGNVLRARFTVSSDAAPTAWAPVRLRVFANDNQNPANLVLSANGYVPAANTSRTYQLFYEAPDGVGTELNVAMWMIDTSATQGGTVRLETVVVDSIAGLDSLFSEVQVIDAGESLTFNNVVELAITPLVTGAASADAFTFTATANAAPNTFEVGQVNNMVASMAANTLYRLVSTVTSTTPVATQPSFGFRLFSDDNAIQNVNRFVGSGAISDVLATTTPKTYTTYLSSEGNDGKELRGSFDMIHNNASRSGNATWDRAVIEAVDLGQIP